MVSSRSAADYRARISDAETVSMWQALTYGISNKCSYCMAVCPAGEELVGEWLEDRKAFSGKVVRPLRKRCEAVYVLPGSAGEAHVKKRFPHKVPRLVESGIRARSASGMRMRWL